MVSVEVWSKDDKKIRLAPGLPLTLNFPDKDEASLTTLDIKRELAKRYPKLYVERQRLTYNDKPLEDGAGLDFSEKPKLILKDLGPQISWRTVYIVEYLGPLFIHPLLYHFPQYFYKRWLPHSQLQTIVYVLIMIHFVKRELETVFIHRFSKATMPRNFIIRNSAHYWLISGLGIAYSTYSPWFSKWGLRGSIRSDPRYVWACVAFWTWAEISNLHTHLTLRNLRPEGSTKRGIPRGYGFDLVSFPNYLFDLLAWLAIFAMTFNWVAGAFFVVASATCTQWAIKKHQAYRKEFGDKYPKDRMAIIPFIL
ncbi:hypothetical protein EXIGLDRAFT_743959 [Exidia glandulosa HHB12029]|uniref:3-oxo-5-alpha-steroid 4-dehydrogenase C-terminal domain-containing protein n=1 Tax=Exidia glandulosa HHB12029 TaxID=1314781 RepID=A0A165QFQ5_EXIGL|nr:hypothetical protein EXIGLDRAFT_743959 [Exidia glandulosa HHB12029]